MPLLHKPHTLYQVSMASNTAHGGVASYVFDPASLEAVPVVGQLTPLKPSDVLNNYGIETVTPHDWLMDTGSESRFLIGTQWKMNGSVYTVVAPVETWGADTVTSFAKVLLEKVQE